MFIREQAINNGIQKVRINLGLLLNQEKDEDAYIDLKELPTLEMMQLSEAHGKGQKDLMLFFKGVLPTIIFDHNIYEKKDKKMTNQELADFIFERLDLTSKVLSDYANASFFSQTNPKRDK